MPEKAVGFMPAKLQSDRVPFKNIRPLGGIPLVNYSLRAINKVKEVQETVLFASEPTICDSIEPGLQYRFLQRPKHLDSQTTSIQDLIRTFLRLCPADLVVLLHITSPFLKPETISECVQMVQSGRYDTAMTVLEMRKFCWFRERPLNYSLDQPTPRTQDIDPVLMEHGSLYVFRQEMFLKTGQRIYGRPYLKRVDHFEGHDIDTEEEFRVAELIVNTGLYTLA